VGARRPLLEVADVVRLYGEDYRREHRLSAAQRKVLRHIATCRTAALGGHVDQCDSCGHQRISYNSCRDRHCPKCQGTQRLQWVNQRLERLVPVPYFHVVFTLPDELNPLILRNKAIGYRILFDAAARTLLQLARNPRHLGADVALTAVLHTWAQNLLFHPHLHCVVSAGGLSADGRRWIPGNDRFFLPVKVLGKLFRGKFLDVLNRAYLDRRLDLAGSTAALSDPLRWAALRNQLYHKDWVIYAKPPFAGTEQLFRYLGHYTHRVAISNHRLLELQDGNVTFSVRDNNAGGKKKRMTLNADEFLLSGPSWAQHANCSSTRRDNRAPRHLRRRPGPISFESVPVSMSWPARCVGSNSSVDRLCYPIRVYLLCGTEPGHRPSVQGPWHDNETQLAMCRR
jgi:hypothetical protein